MIIRLNLEQLIDFPIRNGNFLDHLPTNNPSIKNLPGISDHTPVVTDIAVHTLMGKGRKFPLIKESLDEKVKSSCENLEGD